jgi:RNA polymerase sigma-70 factor (ECF subfamily)
MKDLVHSAMTDEQLINGILKGNKDCFGKLYSRYYSRVYSKCYSFARNSDDAFDMTQEILLKAIFKVGSFGGNSKFSTWLYSITTNYCITQTLKKGRQYHEDIDAAHHILVEMADEDEMKRRVQWEALELNLEEYLNLLNDDERKILVLKYLRNYSLKALQKEFDLSASAVKMRLLRARMKLNHVISLEHAA